MWFTRESLHLAPSYPSCSALNQSSNVHFQWKLLLPSVLVLKIIYRLSIWYVIHLHKTNIPKKQCWVPSLPQKRSNISLVTATKKHKFQTLKKGNHPFWWLHRDGNLLKNYKIPKNPRITMHTDIKKDGSSWVIKSSLHHLIPFIIYSNFILKQLRVFLLVAVLQLEVFFQNLTALMVGNLLISSQMHPLPHSTHLLLCQHCSLI